MTYKTKQDIFNTAYLGLKGQGFEQSVTPSGEGGKMCLYRGPRGLKCAIGHCIPDGKYKGEVLLASAMRQAGIPNKFHKFCGDLQFAHDTSSGASHMKNRLHNFAKHHNLTLPEEVTT